MPQEENKRKDRKNTYAKWLHEAKYNTTGCFHPSKKRDRKQLEENDVDWDTLKQNSICNYNPELDGWNPPWTTLI